jgi:cysteine-rich repeat protein
MGTVRSGGVDSGAAASTGASGATDTGARAAVGGRGGTGGASSGAFAGGAGLGGAPNSGASSGGGAVAGGQPDFDFTAAADQAVTYQIDPAHSGAQLSTPIEAPLRRLWVKQFGAGVSYPIMVDSRVFVSVNPEKGMNSPTVRAFDVTSGEPLWTSEPIEDPPIFSAVHLAYDRGQLFAANRAGNVIAFDAKNGQVRWRTQLKDVYAFATMPVASGGAVFLSAATASSNTLFVLDERDGHLVYGGRAEGIGHLTLAAGKLFSSGGCHETEGMDARTGIISWHYAEDCFGGGGERTVFHAGMLWVGGADSLLALDAETGTRVAELDAIRPFWQISAAGSDLVLPSIAGGNNALQVFEATTGMRRWEIALPDAPVLPVLITPGRAFVLGGSQFEDKLLYGVNLETHELTWQSGEPAAPADVPWSSTGTEPFQAMAAAGGRIAVPYGRSLAVFAAASAVEPPSPVCGNYLLEGNEACDDGNVVDGDYCDASCRAVTGNCGDGIVQDNETCDEAAANCSETCQRAYPGVMLASGNYHTCGLRADGSLRCWGGAVSSSAPTRALRYISAHGNLAAGLLADSSPVFWGSSLSPPIVAGPFLSLEIGADSYCGILADKALDCWNVKAPIPKGQFVELAAFGANYCALTAAGELSCFGRGAVLPWGGSYRAVAVGGTATCAIRRDRTLECSDNVKPPPGQFSAVTAGFDFQCAIRTNGEVTCWGRLGGRGAGQTLAPPSDKFALIDAGWQHVCGVRLDGLTACWGANEGGQATPPMDFP